MEDIVLLSLYDLGYRPEDITDIGKDYYITYSPISEDLNTKSCIIFKDSGRLKLFNGNVVVDGVAYTTMNLTFWLRKTKVGLKHYINKVLLDNNITKRTYLDYIEYVKGSIIKIQHRTNYKFEKIRKVLYNNHILDIDVLNIDSVIETVAKPKKPKVVAVDTKIVESDQYEQEYLDEYLASRCLTKEQIEYKTIVYNGIYRKPSLCFKYPCGFEKYRIAWETDKSKRFRASGKYESFYEVRVNNTKKCYLVEGELEGLTIAKYVDDDILCLHSTNSLPSNFNQLKNYEIIHLKIDKDRFLENKDCFNLPKVIVDYKLEDITKDYNDYHKLGKLNKMLIEKQNYIGGTEC